MLPYAILASCKAQYRQAKTINIKHIMNEDAEKYARMSYLNEDLNRAAEKAGVQSMAVTIYDGTAAKLAMPRQANNKYLRCGLKQRGYAVLSACQAGNIDCLRIARPLYRKVAVISLADGMQVLCFAGSGKKQVLSDMRTAMRSYPQGADMESSYISLDNGRTWDLLDFFDADEGTHDLANCEIYTFGAF